MGRTAGVRGVSLREGDYVIGMDILTPDRESISVRDTEALQQLLNTH